MNVDPEGLEAVLLAFVMESRTERERKASIASLRSYWKRMGIPMCRVGYCVGCDLVELNGKYSCAVHAADSQKEFD